MKNTAKPRARTRKTITAKKKKTTMQKKQEKHIEKATKLLPIKNKTASQTTKRTMPSRVMKRDGSIVQFDIGKIENAIYKAMKASGEWMPGAPEKVARAVSADTVRIYGANGENMADVEGIQDLVEKQLILHRFSATAKAYILYRHEHAQMRLLSQSVPAKVKELTEESKKYFKNSLSEFVFYSTYSRWEEAEGRRETWVETIDRYMDFMRENLGKKLRESEYAEVRQYLLEMKVIGSMRLLWSAGKAARATNPAAYNCSFVAPKAWRDFGEIMYLSMCGAGVGFSVERQHVERLPFINRQNGRAKHAPIVIADSKEGWADALVQGMHIWADGGDVIFDYSKIRPRGARLNTMGGRASGPDPLKSLLDFTRGKMFARQGRRLTTLDVHDIICKIGEIVVAGGVRRSALISLSDLDDQDMRAAKNGQFYVTDPQRTMANNSAVYNEKPTLYQFLDEWHNLVASGSGERGIFNRAGLETQMPRRRWKTFNEADWESSGVNPCGEIILKSKQFCNLTSVVAEAGDTEEDLINKTRVAAILGTYQASLTNFPYLSKEWKKNCEDEALLGVSLTGMWDAPASRDPFVLEKLKYVAVETNRRYAKRFGINPSASVTCIKPSGNSSQLLDCASGLHPRHAPYYIRRIRIESHNPLFRLLKDAGAPVVPEVGQNEATATTWVVEFPVKAPEKAVVRNELSAIDQLESWKVAKEHFTEHNPSVTVSVGHDEWLAVGNWLYQNWEIVGGLSFLPRADHVYQLAPYEEITKEEYEERARRFPSIDFSRLVLYEKEDTTAGAKEYACVAGTCDIDAVPTTEETTVEG